jgi:membrane dipeptidase
MSETAEQIHANAIVIDAACPGDYWRAHWEKWLKGGVTTCCVTVATRGHAGDALHEAGKLLHLIRETPRLRLATSAEDILAAKEAEAMAIVLHFQGAEPLEYAPDLLEPFWRIGVRIIQLAYNRRNPICDGCEEAVDAGLSSLGRRMVAEMARLGILIDVSHTGVRSACQAIEAAGTPCIASHSNAAALHESKRNLPDELIKALAESGGVIGVNGFPAFVAPDAKPTLDQFIDHIVYIDSLVGPGHVGLGIDYYEGTRVEYKALVDAVVWSSSSYPSPPYSFPTSIERPNKLAALTARLLERGYDAPTIRGILGGNWMRVYQQAWSQTR